ncbi:MAG: hypothetical protein ABSH47_26890 [Bryobacteraceae bacterium]|jgi:hypothetical protein
METKQQVKRSNAPWKEKYERLYHYYGRSVVTREECFKFGEAVYDVPGAVISLRRKPCCQTGTDAVYRLDHLLKTYGISLIPEYELKTREFIQERGLKILEQYEVVKEDKLDWLLAQEHSRYLEAGLTPIPERKRIRVDGRDYAMDHFYRDVNGGYLVVELKRVNRYKNNREAVGQILFYMGWVRNHLAKHGENVRGILIVGKQERSDPVLEYGCGFIPDELLRVKYWEDLISIRPDEDEKEHEDEKEQFKEAAKHVLALTEKQLSTC